MRVWIWHDIIHENMEIEQRQIYEDLMELDMKRFHFYYIYYLSKEDNMGAQYQHAQLFVTISMING